MMSHKALRFVTIFVVGFGGLLVTSMASAGPVTAGVSFSATDQGFSDGASRMLGWQFTVGADPIEVTELGFQDFGQDGLLVAHEVGIWRLAGEVLIDSVVVPGGTAGVLDGFFRYAALGSPVVLESGTTYVISGFDPGGADPHVWDAAIGLFTTQDVSGFAVDAAITLGAPGTAHGPVHASFGFPSMLGVPDARAALMGPNLKYSVVPEPSMPVLLCAVLGAYGLIQRGRGSLRGFA